MKRGIRIVGCLMAISAMAAALVVCDGWAEPKPTKANPAFYVSIDRKAEGNEVELEVQVLTEEKDDLELLAKLVEAESGNQSLLGRRMVADVVLNRIDHDDFPDNLHDVVFQKNQFATAGKLDSVIPSELSWEAVYMEQGERVDYDVVYFQTKTYPKFGTPVTQVEDHYFCK